MYGDHNPFPMYKYLFFISVLTIVTACTPVVDTPPGSPSTGTWAPVADTGSSTIPDSQPPLVETLTGTWDAFYPIFDGTGTKVIQATHTSGKPTEISFINSAAQSMEVAITFPDGESDANLRWSQVIMPDGTMDGPFWQKTGYNLNQNGGYTLIFNENQMAGDRWTWRADITITLRDISYDVDTLILP